jgi:hypothetical protein
VQQQLFTAAFCWLEYKGLRLAAAGIPAAAANDEEEEACSRSNYRAWAGHCVGGSWDLLCCWQQVSCLMCEQSTVFCSQHTQHQHFQISIANKSHEPRNLALAETSIHSSCLHWKRNVSFKDT